MGSYGCGHEPDQYDEKIKKKQEEMVELIAENAKVGSYTDQFDERYRRLAAEINILKEEQIETRRRKKLADSYEQRVKCRFANCIYDWYCRKNYNGYMIKELTDKLDAYGVEPS